MDWLVGHIDVFGVTIENWMLVIGGGLLLYIAALVIAERRRPRAR
jgi:hypothetical protein